MQWLPRLDQTGTLTPSQVLKAGSVVTPVVSARGNWPGSGGHPNIASAAAVVGRDYGTNNGRSVCSRPSKDNLSVNSSAHEDIGGGWRVPRRRGEVATCASLKLWPLSSERSQWDRLSVWLKRDHEVWAKAGQRWWPAQQICSLTHSVDAEKYVLFMQWFLMFVMVQVTHVWNSVGNRVHSKIYKLKCLQHSMFFPGSGFILTIPSSSR